MRSKHETGLGLVYCLLSCFYTLFLLPLAAFKPCPNFLHHLQKDTFVFILFCFCILLSISFFSNLYIQWNLVDTVLMGIKNKSVLSENRIIQNRVRKITNSIYLAQNLLLLKNFKIVRHFAVNFCFKVVYAQRERCLVCFLANNGHVDVHAAACTSLNHARRTCSILPCCTPLVCFTPALKTWIFL